MVGVFPLRFETTMGAAAGIEPIAVYGLDRRLVGRPTATGVEAVGPTEAHQAAVDLLRPAELLIVLAGDAAVVRGPRSRTPTWGRSRWSDPLTPSPGLTAAWRRAPRDARSQQAVARARNADRGLTAQPARFERRGVVATGDLGQQRRSGVERATLGQELDDAVPAVASVTGIASSRSSSSAARPACPHGTWP